MSITTDTRNLAPTDPIVFQRGCLTYEGSIVERITAGAIVIYVVDVNAPGGGPIVDRIDIHDGQILRILL